MKAGDMVQRRRLMSQPKGFGMLLEDPIMPSVGDFPKRYRVLTQNGVEEWVDKFKHIIEIVK